MMRIARTLLLAALTTAAVAAPAHAAPWTVGLWAAPKHLLGGDRAGKGPEKVATKGADDLAAGSEGVGTGDDAAGTGGDGAVRDHGKSGEPGGDDSQPGNGNGNGSQSGKGDESQSGKGNGDDSQPGKGNGDDSRPGKGKGSGNGEEPERGKGDDSNRGKGTDDDFERGNGQRRGADDSQRDGGETAAPALGPAGPPVAGKRVSAKAASGEVRVRLPGSDSYVALDAAGTMPVGTLIDARDGAVVLRTALPGGRRDRGTFGGGMFVVRQNVRDGVTELRLRGGSYGRCKTRALASTASKRRRKRGRREIRRLWARDHGGHFRTHGHNSVATVRGTRWLTVERCGGTLTRVTQGTVEVHNRRNGRTVLLHAGESYVAKRHPGRGPWHVRKTAGAERRAAR